MTHTPPVISFAGTQGTDHERAPALSQYLRPALFEGQLHIVTGGGSGIGRCTAHELASLGATVVVIGQAAKVMEIITRAMFEKSGQRVNEPVLKQMSESIERQSAGSRRRFTAARLWDDGIIDPRDTRKILSLCLAIAAEAGAHVLHPNTFGIGRL